MCLSQPPGTLLAEVDTCERLNVRPINRTGTMENEAAAIKAFAIEISRDPREGLTARQRALMACIVIPAPIQQWMLDVGAVEPLLDSIEKTILAAEAAARQKP
jgi:hypothetical protein